MESILNNNIMKEVEKQKDRILGARIEKYRYLGEYKERVIAALTAEEVEEKGIYSEIDKALQKKIATKMLLSRKLRLEKLKKYIYLANKYKVRYKMVDSLSNVGDVALVIAADDAIDNPPDNPIVLSKLEKIRNAGLPDIYYNAIGKKICSKYLDIIEEKIPELVDEYDEITFFDKMIGTKCPIDRWYNENE